MTKRRLMLVFGGRSSEHEVSVRSATEVARAVDTAHFEPVLLGIRRDGALVAGAGDPAQVVEHGSPIGDLRTLDCDVVFPILHGPYGEDGRFQGLLETVGLPYVGSSVLASALCMSKRSLKRYLAGSGAIPGASGQAGANEVQIPTVPWVEHDGRLLGEDFSPTIQAVETRLGYPCFIKPDGAGSSVGVTKANDRGGLATGLSTAMAHDRWVIVEQGIAGRELELAVLGDGGPNTIVSDAGEIILPDGKWYDYDTKYVTDDATLALPAKLDQAVLQHLRALALAAFRSANCHGLARIDFFLETGSGKAYLNEINTLPGFTSISMYPKLMQLAGIAYPELIARLVQLALERASSNR